MKNFIRLHVMFCLLIVFLNHTSLANIYKVGTNKAYSSPNELYIANVLQNGDTIEIDAQEFVGQDALAVWSASSLKIKGVGGKPHLKANGQYILGKAIWVLAGNNITVENIEFSGATVPDKNGAGIRLDGTGMKIRYCYFHHNENGILTTTNNAGNILVEHSEFAYNGYGDGYSHNIYVNKTQIFTFRYNYSHHAKVGHALKSRAKNNFIYYNRIMDEQTGTASRLIDISNGGHTIIMGNLLMQGVNATNNNLISYGLEGLNNVDSSLYVVNNTMVNKRVQSCIFISIQNGTKVASIRNNIFGGTGTLIQGTATTNRENYVNANIGSIAFVDEPNYNYKLTENSPAIDFGIGAGTTVYGISLTPNNAYKHKSNFTLRYTNRIIDAGAYEYGGNTVSNTPINCQASVEIGDICINDNNYGMILVAPNGNCFRLKVTNTGALITEGVNCP